MSFEMLSYFQSLNSQGIATEDAVQSIQERFPSIGAIDILRFARDIYQGRSVIRIHSFPEFSMLVSDRRIESLRRANLANTFEDQLAAWAVLLFRHRYDALETGYALKTEFAETTLKQLKAALENAGYGQSSVLASVACVFLQKISIELQAKPKWQETGFRIEANSRMSGKVVIVRTSGAWTANPATGMVDGNGNPSYIAKAGYTLPGENEGALIGRMDRSLFLVGNHGTSLLGQQGDLAFIINDDLGKAYGDGFSDNQGSLMLELSFSIVVK